MRRLSIRKEPSGAEKRKKKKKQEEFLKSQANAMLKYLKKPEESSFTTPRNDDEDRDDVGESNIGLGKQDECKENDKVVYQNEKSGQKKEHLPKDIFDPGNWGNIDSRLRDLLVKNGPTKRLSVDYRFPKDAIGRHFSHAFYIRELVNGEKVDRQWLVYSKTLDKVFCFCCKLFRHEKSGGGYLVTTGYNDWRNISTRLKEHERRPDHMLCMTRWKMLELGLEKNQTVDKLIKF